jgi:hypothetical protein
MPLIAQRAALAAKQETVEGTPETLAAADVILVYEPTFDDPTDIHERNPIRPTLSQMNQVAGRRYGRLTFKVDLKGSGTAGTAPEWGKLLKFCKMSETIVPATSVTYAPVSTGDPSATLAFYVDGKKYQIAGARGTFRFAASVGEIIRLEFEFWGIVSIVDAALLTGTTFDTTVPVPFMGSAFTLHADANFIAESFEFDLANELALRPSIKAATGIASVLVSNRVPVGAIKVEERLVADFDLYGKKYTNVEGSLSMPVGATAGNIVTLTAPKVRFTDLPQEFRDNILVINVGLRFNMSAGDDEISIALT